MFLLCAFLLMRHRHVTIRHVYWRHPRFHHALYWVSGLAFLEIAAWWLAAELLGLWWLAWLLAQGVTAIVRRRRYVSPQWTRTLAAARPVWPLRCGTWPRR